MDSIFGLLLIMFLSQMYLRRKEIHALPIIHDNSIEFIITSAESIVRR